ncbi:MAG TPA: LysR family transcriptional regulator [Reyranella sp.]
MELRHLRYFVAVAHEGHITRAAEKLHIQQPPLSQQIKALEAEIGAALFVRHPRGVALTDAGRSFQADAEAILASVDRAAQRARRTARGETGRIAVGFTTSAPFHPLVARAIREFRTTRPDVSFVLEESSSSDLLAGLREERLDIAFIRSGLADPQGLTVHALLQEDMAVALPSRHRLARRPHLALKDLAAETFILYRRPDGRGLYDVIIAAVPDRQTGVASGINNTVASVANLFAIAAFGALALHGALADGIRLAMLVAAGLALAGAACAALAIRRGVAPAR